MSIPWVNYDASPLLDAQEKKKQRTQNLLVSAAEFAAGQHQLAAKNLLSQKELNQKAASESGKQYIEQQHVDLMRGQHDQQHLLDKAMALSKARNMMNDEHPDFDPDGARALLKAYGIGIDELGGGAPGGMDPDALLPMGGP